MSYAFRHFLYFTALWLCVGWHGLAVAKVLQEGRAFTPSQHGHLLHKEAKQHLFFSEAIPYLQGHGAIEDTHNGFLGFGMLYYALAYMKRAQVIVCLGSGGGFVPRMLRLAQRDVGLPGSQTILVDGNMGPWGRPQYLSENSTFRQQFPDVRIVIETTANYAEQAKAAGLVINYLHIDADHSYRGARKDFANYAPLMAPDGIITFHDTSGALPCARLVADIRKARHEIVDFNEIGAGVALIRLKKKDQNGEKE